MQYPVSAYQLLMGWKNAHREQYMTPCIPKLKVAICLAAVKITPSFVTL